VRGAFIDSCIRAEVRRAMKAGYEPNRQYLRSETGLSLDQLEFKISLITLEEKQESRGA
jgi:hypothetical protein